MFSTQAIWLAVASKVLSLRLYSPNPYVEAYNNLGVVLASEGRYEEAIAAYNQALEIDPDFQAAQENLAAAEAAIATETEE